MTDDAAPLRPVLRGPLVTIRPGGRDDVPPLHAVEPRIDPPPDNPHIADVVLRARRR